MPMPNFPHIPPFRPFIPPMSLPAVYGDELSYMELLGKVEKWLSDLVESNNLQNAAIVALYAAWEEFKNGGYTESFEQFLDQWFADNQEHIEELLTGQFADELAALREETEAATAAVGTKVNKPVSPASEYGTSGQVLSTLGNGKTQWVDPIVPTDAQAETYITKWMNENPQATTTVQEGSITTQKLANGAVTDAKLAQNGGILEKVDNLERDVTEIASATTDAQYDAIASSNPRTGCAVQYNADNDNYAFYDTQVFREWNSFIYDVSPNTKYLANGSKYPSTPTVIFLDSAGNYIGNDGFYPNYTDWTAINNAVITRTPNNCAKIIVQKLGLQTPPTLLVPTLVNNLYDDVSILAEKVTQLDDILRPGEFSPIETTLRDGYYIGDNHVEIPITAAQYKITNNIPVSVGDRIIITATVGYKSNMFYIFKNAIGEYVDGIVSQFAGTQTFDVIVPANASLLVVSAYNGIASVSTISSYTIVGKWKGKKWVCLGDSLTEVNSRTTMHYHDYIAAETEITVINMGDSGSGYMNEQDLGTAFYQRAANVPTDADVYTIFGSGNDLSHPLGEPTDTGTTTICGCINETIDVLINRIPTIQLGIVAPTPWAPYKPDINNTNLMAKYVQALKDICYIRSIPFLDLYHESNLRPWTAEGRAACYSKDNGGGTHPDEAGHKIIAPRFEGFLDTLLLD